MAKEERQYEIIETVYRGGEKTKTKVDFLGTLEEAKKRALKEAAKNIGTRYAVFPQEGFVADFQAYYRTSVKCPKCGEVIPIE
jgi:hypothetical protein